MNLMPSSDSAMHMARGSDRCTESIQTVHADRACDHLHIGIDDSVRRDDSVWYRRMLCNLIVPACSR